MHRRFGRLSAGIFLTLGIVVIAALAAGANPGTDRPSTITTPDGVADTVNNNTGALTVFPRADVTRAVVSMQSGSISFAMWRTDATNPLRDLNWTSDYTYGQWWLDVTGDLVTDYVAQYSIQDGEIRGLVNRVSDPDDADPLCTASVALNDGGADAFQIDAGCLGNPQRLSYQMAIIYDTDVNNEDAAVVTDSVPDHGMAGPVFAPGATAIAPMESKPLSVDTPTTTAPKPAAAPAGGSPATVAPTTTAPAKVPAPATKAPVENPAPAARKTPTPRMAAPGAPKIRPATRPPAAAAGATNATSPTPALARTGAPHTLRLFGLGVGLLFLGVGVRLMAGDRRRLPTLPV